jgi:biotin transporter BioY
MLLVAIGWIYVVLMMSVAEETVVAGVMTFVFYGVVPVALILYISGSGKRKRLRARLEEEKRAAMMQPVSENGDDAQAR